MTGTTIPEVHGGPAAVEATGGGRLTGALVLEDGTVYAGEVIGGRGTSGGEVVFNTGMTGYGEILTDPSYCGQIVTLTYPLVGNYGVSGGDLQSARPLVSGLVVHQACFSPSHREACWSLDDFLRSHGVVGLQGVDTRALVRHLRRHGTMRGVITSHAVLPSADGPAGAGPLTGGGAGGGTGGGPLTGGGAVDDAGPGLQLRELLERARAVSLRGVVYRATCSRPYHLSGRGPRVVVVDLGVKAGILQALARRGCSITVVPATSTAADIMGYGPRGVLFSNGPGDPEDAREAIAAAGDLLGRVPLFGICLGHQVMALATGARTFRLKYGHRGANHPVDDLSLGRVFITSQNHGYAVAEEGLPAGVTVTARNLNDGTVEGLEFAGRDAFSVQYHPEAGPGPRDTGYLFDRFLALATGGKWRGGEHAEERRAG
ncbi:MAG: carbamoyl phosphate synthase small subunit [Bacillota bacterium]|nr:carbamoyl phosphate synthase small subunit [Bacillota bacterium]